MKRNKSNYKSQNDQQIKKNCQQRMEDIKNSKIRMIGKEGFEKCVEDYFKRILDTNDATTECSDEVPKTSNVEKLLGEIVNNQKRLIRIVEEMEWKVENINDRIKLNVNSSPTTNNPYYYPDKYSNRAR